MFSASPHVVKSPEVKTKYKYTVKDISPLPKLERVATNRKKRANYGASVLTSSPHKKFLEERDAKRKPTCKAKQTQAKQKLALSTKNIKAKAGKRNSPTNKTARPLATCTEATGTNPSSDTSLTKRRQTKKKQSRASVGSRKKENSQTAQMNNKEDWTCLVCGENRAENSIQCSRCLLWAHEACANILDAQFYYCDRCSP